MGSGQYTYPYPRPMVTVDAAVFALRDARLEILLIRRGHEPFKGMWAIPGGFVEMEEELETAAARELEEETCVAGVRLEQVGTFGAVDRDPRGRVITVLYAGVTDWRRHAPRACDDAADAGWLPVNGLPRLASDHNLLVRGAVEWLAAQLRAGRPILPPEGIDADQFAMAVDACR